MVAGSGDAFRGRQRRLNPIMPSPNDDWGYDVSDYCGVHPDLGRLEDLDDLVAEATKRDLRVLLDLVPNHTSDQHLWFQESRDRASPVGSSTCGQTGRQTASPTSTGGTKRSALLR